MALKHRSLSLLECNPKTDDNLSGTDFYSIFKPND